MDADKNADMDTDIRIKNVISFFYFEVENFPEIYGYIVLMKNDN